MCYSALVKKSLSKLEKELGKELGKEYYEKLYTTIKTDPRKIKFPGFDNRIYPNYVAIIERNENHQRIEEPMRFSCYLEKLLNISIHKLRPEKRSGLMQVKMSQNLNLQKQSRKILHSEI